MRTHMFLTDVDLNCPRFTNRNGCRYTLLAQQAHKVCLYFIEVEIEGNSFKN